jgi:thioredoxin-related protein
MQANGFTGKALYDAGELAEGLGVNGLPHTILFNKKHQAVKVWEGYRPDMEEVVSVEIDKLVK